MCRKNHKIKREAQLKVRVAPPATTGSPNQSSLDLGPEHKRETAVGYNTNRVKEAFVDCPDLHKEFLWIGNQGFCTQEVLRR